MNQKHTHIFHTFSISEKHAFSHRQIQALTLEKQTDTWFTINLGNAILAGKSLDHIKVLFLSEHEVTLNTKEMAIFVRYESEGRRHGEVNLYFSKNSNNRGHSNVASFKTTAKYLPRSYRLVCSYRIQSMQ